MKIVALSDTHMRHERLFMPPCDLLIHAGDCTQRGTAAELTSVVRWLGAQPATARVLIAGNHDFVCEQDRELPRRLCAEHGVVYLEDEAVTLCGLRIWGSPITPSFGSWAFQRERGADIASVWAKIPTDTDVLVTHGPPHGIGDRIWLGRHVGCEALRDRVLALRPRLHLFGHIHEAHGEHTPAGSATRYFNVAVRSLVPLFPDADITRIEL